MWKEFKEFAMQGNVVDLAVAVVIGAAFGKIVTSVVDYLIMPIVGVLMGGVDFSGLAVEVGSAKIGYGMVIQDIIDFIIVAFCIFLMVKGINKVKKPADDEEALPSDNELLTEIRDILKDKQN